MIAAALLLAGLALALSAHAAGAGAATPAVFPPPLVSYQDGHLTTTLEVLRHRVQVQPFNLWASLLFLGAILHTFLCQKLRHIGHVLEERHQERQRQTQANASHSTDSERAHTTSKTGRLLHFLGEVEVVFGIWVLPLAAMMTARFGQRTTVDYLNHRVNYTEAVFVVVIMAMSLTRPVLGLAEQGMRRIARTGGGSPLAWWVSILTLGPLLGSFITEPAAMAISASLLASQFYALQPRAALGYGTLGLLFVNVSIGGTLTHFAAPPVLMVAGPWQWNSAYMLTHFGWKALLAILIANGLYAVWFRKDFAALKQAAAASQNLKPPGDLRRPTPAWVTGTNLAFMAFAVLNAHNPAMLIGTFLFFLAFTEVTQDYQTELQLRSPILVGFFLAGLVIHGGLQEWWIGPLLRNLQEVPLFLGSLTLTAFNDNAAITYLATLVPNLPEAAKQAVVAGAVAGGGLTVIANAPNPAGQAILNRFFPEGISPVGLLLGALAPTAVAALCFLAWR